MRVGECGEIVAIEAVSRGRATEEVNAFVPVEMMLAEILADENLYGVPESALAQIVSSGGKRRVIEKGESWESLALGFDFVLDADTGVSEAGDRIIALEGQIRKTEFEVRRSAELQQTVYVLMTARCFDSVLCFQNATLNGFGGCGECGSIGNSSDGLVIRAWGSLLLAGNKGCEQNRCRKDACPPQVPHSAEHSSAAQSLEVGF